MEVLKSLIDLILHIDKHLTEIIAHYGTLTYAILFLIIFVETGLVFMPLLPGDSLLFAAGALAANEANNLSAWIIFALLSLAAILGDTLNYHIGKFLGPKVFSGNLKLLNKQHLDKTQAFYEKYGGKTIIIARFVPIVRTFAPFVAGIGTMNYGRFLQFNVVGAILWVGVCTLAGYFFGGLEVVKKNFSLVVLGIIGISLLPIVFEVVKEKLKK